MPALIFPDFFPSEIVRLSFDAFPAASGKVGLSVLGFFKFPFFAEVQL